jgi:ABC-type bacteriocin/lantibiotic exporter with double-glycine peptidase domain
MKRRFLVPEVVQTSALDCGPATLKALLEGFGINISYGRLREACQTDLDGTSVDTIEDVAREIGLSAEQVMVPADHLVLDRTMLPAVVVVRLPHDLTHFVLVWRKVGPFFQIMDPATGRHWCRARGFLADVYSHRVTVPGQEWKTWGASEPATTILADKLSALGRRDANRLVCNAAQSPDWRILALLDAAARFTTTMVERGAAKCGAEATRLVDALMTGTFEGSTAAQSVIPAEYWNARPVRSAVDGLAVEGVDADAHVSGAVLLRVTSGLRTDAEYVGRSREVAAAATEEAPKPLRRLLSHLRGESMIPLVIAAIGLAALGAVLLVEGLLLRGIIEFNTQFTPVDQRLRAVLYLAVFGATVLLLELKIAAGLLRYGRVLEIRFRMALWRTLARLNDQYFRSRLVSDMAERIHAVHHLQSYPALIGRFVRSVIALVLTSAGIVLIEPHATRVVMVAVAITLALSIGWMPLVVRHQTKVRTHAGALARFYLDALLGLNAIRAHTAEAAIRREQEPLLVEWSRATLAQIRAMFTFEATQMLVGFGFATWLLKIHLAYGGEPGATLLLMYWALNIPLLGAEIASSITLHAEEKVVTLRLLEPLGQSEQRDGTLAPPESLKSDGGMGVSLRGVSVRAASHIVLDSIDLDIARGSHVAIVGRSGAGKSSLVGLLLGWHRPTAGDIFVDGRPVTEDTFATLRSQVAWVDPTVHLWNESLEYNLSYGAATPEAARVGEAARRAELSPVIERLSGMQGSLGEAGGLLSGGEGQRVRLGRALMNTRARLVILDEAFRGLDRPSRRRLLERSRTLWRDVTMLCVTHDVGDTRSFDRVLVIENGRIVEDGSPSMLAVDRESRYYQMLAEEDAVHQMWTSQAVWRRINVDGGAVAPVADDPWSDWDDERALSYVASR